MDSRTQRKEQRPPGGRARSAPQLYLVLEAERPVEATSRHALDGVDEIVIGRGEPGGAERSVTDGARRLTLRVPDHCLSRRHVRLIRRGGTCTVQDLGSTNGTQVNGSAISSQALVDGDLIGAGHTFFLYRAAATVTGDDPEDDVGTPARGVMASLVPSLRARFAEVEPVARSAVSVVIGGETGTGKELLARAVHALSGRPGAFVAVNCGAIPRTLVESELFGHKKGAFSGATADRTGLIAAADRGTLFLDEIADLPLESQAAFLRVLEEHEVTPVGATRAEPIDLRVISASHTDIDVLAATGRFRPDLAARLSGFPIRLPPLRDRREDLGLLIAAILRDLGAGPVRFAEDAARALLMHDWPRNVRELRNCLETALALSGGRTIQLDHLGAVATARVEVPAEAPLHAQLEALLREHRGNVSAVARALGKARPQVQRWLRRHGLDALRFR